MNKQLGALRHQGKRIPLSCRKLLASGMILSRLIYLIPLWGSSTSNYLRRMQQFLNKVAKWTTGLGRRTKTRDLMKASGLLSIREMILQHSLMLMWKVIHLKKPMNLYREMRIDEEYKIEEQVCRLQFTKRGFRQRTSTQWNEMPPELRGNKSMTQFKIMLKRWVLEKREQDPD